MSSRFLTSSESEENSTEGSTKKGSKVKVELKYTIDNKYSKRKQYRPPKTVNN